MRVNREIKMLSVGIGIEENLNEKEFFFLPNCREGNAEAFCGYRN